MGKLIGAIQQSARAVHVFRASKKEKIPVRQNIPPIPVIRPRKRTERPPPAIAGEGQPHPIRLTEPGPGSCFLPRSRKPRMPAARNGRLPSRNRKTFRSVARTHKKAAGPIRTRTGNRRLHKRRGNETARSGGGRGGDRELAGNGTDTQGLRRWCPQYDAERSHMDRDHRRRAKSTRNIAAPSGTPCPQYGKASGAVGATGKAPCPRCGKRTAPAVFP